MKRGIIVSFVLFIMTVTGVCSFAYGEETPQPGAVSRDVSVDIFVNGDGFYSLFGEAEIVYNAERELSTIRFVEPFLVGYNVSSQYEGAWLLSLAEGRQIVSVLTEVREILNADDSGELAARIDAALEAMAGAGPYTNASS